MSKSFSFPPPPPPPPKAIEDNSQHSTFAVSGHHGRGRAGFNSMRGVNSRSRGRGPRGRGYDFSHHSRPGGSHYRSSEVAEAVEPGSRLLDTNKRGRGYHARHVWTSHQADLHPHKIGLSSKPAKAKVEAPPTIPSFASPLVALSASKTPPNADEQLSPKVNPIVTSNRKRKRTTNQLGLTPHGDEYQESEDEEVDEEAAYSKHATGSLVIEYGGKTSILGSSSDIAAWIAERKKRWPTKARIEEKKKLEAERQEQIRLKRREETQRLVDLKKSQDEARRIAREAERAKTATQHPKSESSQDPTTQTTSLTSAATTTTTAAIVNKESSKLEKQRLKVEKLKRKLERSEAKFAKTNAAQLRNSRDDEEEIVGPSTGDDLNMADVHVDTTAKSEDRSAEMLESIQTGKDSDFDSDLSSAESSESSSEDDTSDSSSTLSDESVTSKLSAEQSDAGLSSSPEETTSKMTPLEPATLPETSQPQQTSKTQPCRNMRRFGRCKYGDSCRYSHEMRQSQNKPVEKPGSRSRKAVVGTEQKRTSLYQRMLEKELEEESRFVLEVIKYLGQGDFFRKG